MASIYMRMPLLVASIAAHSSFGLAGKSGGLAGPVSAEDGEDGAGERWWPMPGGFLMPHPTAASTSETESAGTQAQIGDMHEEPSPHTSRHHKKQIPARHDKHRSVTPKLTETVGVNKHTFAEDSPSNSTSKSKVADSSAGSNTENTGSVDAKQLNAVEEVATRWANVEQANETATISESTREEKATRIEQLVARIARDQQVVLPDSELSEQVDRLQVIAAHLSDMQGKAEEGPQSRKDIKRLGVVAQKAMELERRIAAKVEDKASGAAAVDQIAGATSEDTVTTSESSDAVASARFATSEDAVISGESGDAAANALQAAAAAAAEEVQVTGDGSETDDDSSKSEHVDSTAESADAQANASEGGATGTVAESGNSEASVDEEEAVTDEAADTVLVVAEDEDTAIEEDREAQASSKGKGDTNTVKDADLKAHDTEDSDVAAARKRANKKFASHGEHVVAIDEKEDAKVDATEDDDAMIAGKGIKALPQSEDHEDDGTIGERAHVNSDVAEGKHKASTGDNVVIVEEEDAMTADEIVSAEADLSEGNGAMTKGKHADTKRNATEVEGSVTADEGVDAKADAAEDSVAETGTESEADSIEAEDAVTIDEGADSSANAAEDADGVVTSKRGHTKVEATKVVEDAASMGESADTKDAETAEESRGTKAEATEGKQAKQASKASKAPKGVDREQEAAGASHTDARSDAKHPDFEATPQAPEVPDFGHASDTQKSLNDELSSINPTSEREGASVFKSGEIASASRAKDDKEPANHSATEAVTTSQRAHLVSGNKPAMDAKGSISQEVGSATPHAKSFHIGGNVTGPKSNDSMTAEPQAASPRQKLPFAKSKGAHTANNAEDAESVAKKLSHLQEERDELATQLQKAVEDNENMRDLMVEAADKLEIAKNLKMQLDNETAQHDQFVRELEAEKLVIAQSHQATLVANGSTPIVAEAHLPHLPSKYLGLKHIAPMGGTFATALFTRMTKELPVFFPGQGEFYRYYDQLTAIDRQSDEQSMFLVSMVRNPCDWYVSLWAHAAEYDAAVLHQQFGNGDDPQPFFSDGNANKTKFANWLRWAQGNWGSNASSPDSNSIMSLRYWEAFVSKKPVGGLNQHGYNGLTLDKYGHFFDASDVPREKVDKDLEGLSPAAAVDCWIESEHYMEDTNRCLSEYEKATDVKLDWRPFTQALLNKGSAGIPGKEPKRESCEYYYTPELAASVMHHDRHLFEAFGYETCCGASQKPTK